MRTEVTWVGANPPQEVKGTVAAHEYLELLNEADISIKTASKESRISRIPRLRNVVRAHSWQRIQQRRFIEFCRVSSETERARISAK
jgi:hypothetical protein